MHHPFFGVVLSWMALILLLSQAITATPARRHDAVKAIFSRADNKPWQPESEGGVPPPPTSSQRQLANPPLPIQPFSVASSTQLTGRTPRSSSIEWLSTTSKQKTSAPRPLAPAVVTRATIRAASMYAVHPFGKIHPLLTYPGLQRQRSRNPTRLQSGCGHCCPSHPEGMLPKGIPQRHFRPKIHRCHGLQRHCCICQLQARQRRRRAEHGTSRCPLGTQRRLFSVIIGKPWTWNRDGERARMRGSPRPR